MIQQILWSSIRPLVMKYTPNLANAAPLQCHLINTRAMFYCRVLYLCAVIVGLLYISIFNFDIVTDGTLVAIVVFYELLDLLDLRQIQWRRKVV